MKLTLRVDQGDGPMEVTTNLYTIVAWERKYKTKASNIANGIGMEDLAFRFTAKRHSRSHRFR